jgi:hypothetical protein
MEANTLKSIMDSFRLIVDNMTVTFKDDSEPTTVNLAHIPISLEAFQEFWRKNVISKDTTFYSYFRFLNDILKELMTTFLSSQCAGGLISSKIRPFTGIVSSQGEINPDLFARWAGDQRVSPGYRTLNIDNMKINKPAFEFCNESDGEPFQYLAISAQEKLPASLEGDEADDKENGIYHFRYGATSGILKTAKFNKTDQEFLPEARWASEGNLVFNQLAGVYDATFNMLGNTLFHPGQMIYFNAEDIGVGQSWQASETDQSWSNVMGLGGYHVITLVESEISRSGYATSVTARWVTGGKRNDKEET